jgi:hypothetical protein
MDLFSAFPLLTLVALGLAIAAFTMFLSSRDKECGNIKLTPETTGPGPGVTGKTECAAMGRRDGKTYTCIGFLVNEDTASTQFLACSDDEPTKVAKGATALCQIRCN